MYVTRGIRWYRRPQFIPTVLSVSASEGHGWVLVELAPFQRESALAREAIVEACKFPSHHSFGTRQVHILSRLVQALVSFSNGPGGRAGGTFLLYYPALHFGPMAPQE